MADLARRLRQIGGAALVDSLGAWVTLQPEFDVVAGCVLELPRPEGHAC